MSIKSVRTPEQVGKSEQKTQLKKQELSLAVSQLTEQYQRTEAAFREQNVKSAETVLALCKVAHDAQVALGKHREFLTKFREDNRLTNKSTFSQFCTIGKNHERLTPLAAALPSSWYALYRIAKLDDAAFGTAVENSKFHPLISQREIKELSGKKSTPKGPDLHVVIDLVADDAFSVIQAAAFQKALIAFLREQHTQWSCVDPDIRRSKALEAALGESPVLSQKKAA
jgi:hypothetical protein